MAKVRLKTIGCLLGCGALVLSALSGCNTGADSSLPSSAPPSSVLPAVAPVSQAEPQGPEGVLFFGGLPSGLMLQEDTLVLCDGYSKQIWAMGIAGGEATVLAGREGVPDLNGIPIGGYHDASAEEASFAEPWGVSNFLGGMAITDTANNVVRILKEGRVFTIAGTGEAGLQDGNSVEVRFHSPTGISTGEDGALYVADTGNHLIRRIDTDGQVTIFAGSAEGLADGPALQSAFRSPTGLFWKNGALYVADSGNHRVCIIEDGVVTTLAGNTDFATEEERLHGALVDGTAGEAMFSNPQGIVVADDGTVYVADTGNGAIRRLVGGQVETIQQSSDDAVYPISPRGLLVCGQTLYVSDVFAGLVYALAL